VSFIYARKKKSKEFTSTVQIKTKRDSRTQMYKAQLGEEVDPRIDNKFAVVP
jgi:hypothetical protein